MPQKLIAKSLVILCTPLSAPVLILWMIFAGGVAMAGEFWATLSEMHRAILVEPNFPLAFYIARQLIGVFGGLLGWISLVALGVMWNRPWRRIPTSIKFGCLVGAVSAALIPAAPGLALPPIILCAALCWLAHQRDRRPAPAQTNPEFHRSSTQAHTHGGSNAENPH